MTWTADIFSFRTYNTTKLYSHSCMGACVRSTVYQLSVKVNASHPTLKYWTRIHTAINTDRTHVEMDMYASMYVFDIFDTHVPY